MFIVACSLWNKGSFDNKFFGSGANVAANAGNVNLNGGSVNANAGSVNVNGGSTTVNGGTVNGGTVNGGTTTVNGGTTNVNGGTTTVNGGTVNGGTTTVNGGTTTVNGGTTTTVNGGTTTTSSSSTTTTRTGHTRASHNQITITPPSVTLPALPSLPNVDLGTSGNIANPQTNYDGFKKTIFYGFLVALGFAFLWMLFVHCAPRLAPIVAIIGAIVLLLALGILLILANASYWGNSSALKIILAVFCFLLMIVLIGMLCAYSNEIKFQGLMLQYAVRFLNENPCVFAYIPLYMLFALGLVALITWQHCCFSSWNGSNNNFFDFSNSGFWGVLNVLEFIWGMQFLRDSFNFCVSGCAVDWYYTGRSDCYAPYQRLLCYHWGSVVGGSFLNAFFELPTLLVELLVCHPQTCCSKLGTFCYNSCNCCTCFFDLVRTDAYGYMNLSGIPFCNSARACKRLCENSNQFVGSHSAMKHYRFAAHVFVIAAVALLTYFILKYRTPNFGFWHIAIGIALIYATVTWFIDIHADAAEGLQTAYLSEHELDDYPYMQKILPSYRKELQHMDNRSNTIKKDGNC